MRRASVLLMTAIVASCTGGSVSVVRETPLPGSASPTTNGWVTMRFQDAGYSVSFPSRWHRAATLLTPQLTDPQEILAVGSYPLRPGSPAHCVSYPINALEDLTATDTLVWVAERRRGVSPPRSGLFLRSDLQNIDEPTGCLSEPKVFFHGVSSFEDAGRAFDVFVAWGHDASAQTKKAALAVLDSLRFDPAPIAPLATRCGMLDPGGDRYNTVMLPTRAAPGDEVVLSGPTYRGEDGRYFPSDRLEVWFNSELPTSHAPNASPIAPGPIVHLATVHDMKRCTFSTRFTVPDVTPGRYEISVFVFYEAGYGFWLPHTLTVT
jgi:hypothetical protein